jgi:hypothetical protein
MNPGPRPHRRAAVPALLAGLALVLLVPPADAVDPTVDGVSGVEGVVRHGTAGGPVAGVEVLLTERDEGAGTELARTTTDADGRFWFDGPVDGPVDGAGSGPEHEVVVTYDGAEYRSGPIVGRGGASVDVEVFESTTSADDVVVASWVVWIDRADRVVVQQDLQVENRGERTYVGEVETGAGARAVISVPVASGASDLRFLGRFTGCCATMRGTTYVHTTPLAPGTAVGTLRFAVDQLDTFTFPATLAVESFTLMVPAGSAIASTQLERSGEIESQGSLYDVYTAEDLARGEVLEVSVRGPAASGRSWWPPVAAALTALLVAMVVVGRRRRRDATPAPAAPHLSSEVLLEELALLDVGYERGLIPPEVYEPLREARTAELRGTTTRS